MGSLTNPSGEGYQLKYASEGYSYKEDTYRYESYAELISSSLNTCLGYDSVKYELTDSGCRSKEWLGTGEKTVTYHTLLSFLKGGSTSRGEWLRTEFNRGYDALDKYEMFSEVLTSGLGFTQSYIDDYMKGLLLTDWVMLNPDRHFGNIALIKGKDAWRFSPYFDYGLGLRYSDRSCEPFADEYQDQYETIFGPISVSWCLNPLTAFEDLPKVVRESTQGSLYLSRLRTFYLTGRLSNTVL